MWRSLHSRLFQSEMRPWPLHSNMHKHWSNPSMQGQIQAVLPLVESPLPLFSTVLFLWITYTFASFFLWLNDSVMNWWILVLAAAMWGEWQDFDLSVYIYQIKMIFLACEVLIFSCFKLKCFFAERM